MMKAVCGLLIVCGALSGAEYRAGIGRAVITPQSPMWMAGYASRSKPSEGVIHDLWAKALVVDDGRAGRVVLVSADLIAVPREICEEVCARLKKKHGIERSQILINASHTHSGPVVWPSIRIMLPADPEQQMRAQQYGRQLTDDLVRVVDQAMADLAPAELSVGHGKAAFAVNRREPKPEGVRIGVNREGPVDHDVPVLKVSAPDGKIRAMVFGYACHNTTLGGDNYRLHGDYAGFAQIELEKSLPGSTAMFLSLCGADQNPNPRGTLAHAEKYGRALGEEVRRVLNGDLRRLTAPIRTAYEVARLDFAPQTRATFEAEAKSTDRFRKARAEIMLQGFDAGNPMRQIECPVQAFRWGEQWTLIALGGEVVVDYALRLKREHPGQDLVVAGYSNDVMCYLPSRRVLGEGGYEPVESMIYYGRPGPLAENVEETVIEACGRVLQKTKASP